MGRFRRVTNGTSGAQSPARSAAWLNAVSQSTEHFLQQVANGQASGNSATAHGLVNPVKVRNLTGGNRVRGEVVQLGDSLLSPFDPRNPWFEGNTYDEDSPRPIALVVDAVVTGEIIAAAVDDVCVARVNVTNLSHRFAIPSNGQHVLSSTDAGDIRIISKLTSTGIQEVHVVFRSAPEVTVYLFWNCEDSTRILYLDNPEIAEHEPDEVAVIKIDGVYECWRLIGDAPRCKTGECADIIAWGTDCEACSVCFYLTPCGGGSPTFVRGVEWYEHEGRIVLIDVGAGEGCYTVAVADGCFDVSDYTVDDVVRSYDDCDQCGCYELENCADSGDVQYVANDLAAIVGAASGAAAVGEFVKHAGVCYEITDFLAPCTEETATWDDAGITRIESCSGCCWLLTPCPEQAGDPEPAYYRLTSDDPDLTAFVNEDGTSNGRVIRLAGICYSVSIPETCPEEDVILGLPTVEEEYDECGDCIPSCWERCDAPGTYLHTYSDMKEVGPNAAVKRASDGFCYKRSTLSNCDGEPLVDFGMIEEIIDEGVDSCTICQDPKVKLTPSCGGACPDCSGSSSGGSSGITDPIVTDDADLFPHVGKYVKVDGQCYFVEWTTETVTQADVCFTGPYDSCAACAAAPSKVRVLGDVFFNEAGELVKRYVDLYGVLAICGSEDVVIATSEECEEPPP